MAMTAETVAWQIDDGNIDGVEYDPDGANSTIFLNLVPALPDLCVTVSELGGNYLEWCNEGITEYQIRVRGLEADQHSASTITHEIVAHLRSTWGPVTTWAAGETAECQVVACETSAPYLIGWDEQGRPEFGIRITVRHAA